MIFIVPGIIAFVYFSFSYQAIILKDISGFDALVYSKFLVKGHWWRVFFLTLLYIGSIFGINEMIHFLNNSVYISIISDTAQSFIIFYSLTVMTLFFLNLDSIKNT